MGKDKKYDNIGNDLESAVLEGIKTGDFSKISPVITKSVETVIDDVGQKIKESVTTGVSSRGGYSTGEYTRMRQEACERERAEKLRQREQERIVREQARQKKNAERAELRNARNASVPADIRKSQNNNLPALVNKNHTVSSTLLSVAGGIGLGITGVTFLTSLPALIAGSASVVGLSFCGIFAAGFGIVLANGLGKGKMASMAKRYASFCGNKGYVEIDDIVSATGESRRKVVRQVKKLLKGGYFPHGRIDEGNKTLILTDEVYQMYLDSKVKETMNSTGNIIDSTARIVGDDDNMSELNQMIAEGTDYIHRLHNLNEHIPGEVITEKLDRLEALLNDIFMRVKEHPEQMSRMHELMEYYLPTMIKLVSAYEEYDKVSVPSKEIVEAKKDIEKTLDTINAAFSKLLSNLFQDSVWDVTTDAQVLKTMLAQKGLADGMEGE